LLLLEIVLRGEVLYTHHQVFCGGEVLYTHHQVFCDRVVEDVFVLMDYVK